MGIKDKEKNLEGIRRKCKVYEISMSCGCCFERGLFKSDDDINAALANARQEGDMKEIKDATGRSFYIDADAGTYFDCIGKYKAGVLDLSNG